LTKSAKLAKMLL